MAALPKDVTEHLEAAIQLSNRRVHLRFLDEAEVLIALNLPAAAILIVGVVLESIFAGTRPEGTSEEWQQIERWFDLRNNLLSVQELTATLDQASEMVKGIRRFLAQDIGVSPRVAQLETAAKTADQVRGKYQHLPTFSVDFIRRKADEKRLERE